jgi:bifunctional oligoribonuclease and PAP phosphatase NrnA
MSMDTADAAADDRDRSERETETARRYRDGIERAAAFLRRWRGPIVIVAHERTDGDAVGSVLTLGRALRTLGSDVTMAIEPPAFLAFLAVEGELSRPLETLEPDTLLVILDTEPGRMVGAPAEGAAALVNLDHHGTNPGAGEVAVVAPEKAAAALMVKDVVDALGVAWDSSLATPCLVGLVSDTGGFRFGNTDRDVLEAAADLLDVGVPYAEIMDRLRLRVPGYFPMLALVMATVRFHEDGVVVSAHQSAAMRASLAGLDVDSDDFVNVIRDADGTRVALFLRETDDGVKVSVRSRDGVSAQAICLALGGGGHVAAAGATLRGVDLARAYDRVLEATRAELGRS